MLFNSLEYAIFFIAIYTAYWWLNKKSLVWQNMLLLGASYYFYSCWNWKFLFLLVFSTVLDFYSGHKIFTARTPTQKKLWLAASVIINLGFLGIFKYYNFFITSFVELIAQFGYSIPLWTLQVILPVGISFYTFHGLSYVFDIYKDKIKPEKDFVIYSLFVSFFPLLVAGPIERATHLLPQLKVPRIFDYDKSVNGLRQILWGLFKKVAVADACSPYVNTIFDSYATQSGSTLLLGAFLFAIQIYCDFSGYSDIALGTARLMGIELLQNFSFPYFSRDIAEFWRRWHISLSSWFRDYLYIPLGGSKVNTIKKIRNVFIIFIVSGFWHGANWTFIIWGLLNALYIMPSIFLQTNRNHLHIVAQDSILPSIKEFLQILFTFLLTTLAWIFFRSQSVFQAIHILHSIFSTTFFSMPTILPWFEIFVALCMLMVEWSGRKYAFALGGWSSDPKHRVGRWIFYLLLLLIIAYYFSSGNEFIYFQF